MSRFSNNEKSNEKNDGVSAIVGVLVLVLLVLVLSAGVLFTANNMLGEQPTDMTAGTTTERITDYEYQTQLVSQGNAQTVEVVSPLGTHYKLTQVGDATRILAVAPNGNESQVRDMRVVGLEQQTDKRVDNEDAVQETGEQQVLERKQVKDGIETDVIVDKYGTGDYQSIQTAINTIDSAVDRPITKDNPAVIVVERAVYKENIDVSQNISLIAEHGTVIEDSEPNENVVDITGDNTEFRNFDINGDPVPNDNHYGLHGINIEGESAKVVGNHVYNSSSPDLTSAGVNVAGTASILKFNSVESNQRSLQFDDGAKYPFVCGNQLDNTIAGQLSQRNINEVTKNNYWKEGVPVTLIPENSNRGTQLSKVKQRIVEANNKVPVNKIPADVGRAGQPFPGTKLQAGDLTNCDLTISFTNTFNQSFNIENMEVQIEERNTTLEVVARDTVTYETGDGANKRDELKDKVICYCGGDNKWDRNDTFELDPIEANISTNPVETAQAVNIVSDGGGGSGGSGGSSDGGTGGPTCDNSDVDLKSGKVTYSGSCFDYDTNGPDPPEKTDEEKQSSDGGSVDTQTFQIILGTTVEVQLADKVTLSAAVSGAQGDVGYEWSLGDGTNKSGKQVSHLYNDSGTYQVCLYAWDKATNQSDYDCTTATVEEGKKDLEKIRQETKEKLQERIDEAKENKVIYLEEGDYDSLDIKVPGLTVIGNGDVDIQQSAKVTAEDVTVKNIDFENGLSVYQDGFKLWNGEVSNSDGYAMEVDADGNKFLYIGNSKIQGQNSLYMNTDSDATIQNNNITASGEYGLKLGSRMDGIRVTENTITANEYGIHRGHATTIYLENNQITAKNNVYRVQNQPPTISNINPDVSLAHLPTSFSANFKEPDGDRIVSTKWSLNSDRTTLSPSSSFVTTVDETGEHTVRVQATDNFGATDSVQKNFMFEEPSISLQSPSLVSENDDVTISVDTNVPGYRINYVTYKWGDGSQIKTGSLSRTTQYDAVGNYTATVVLGTDSGFTIEKQTQINVTDSPVANYYASPSGEQFYVGEPIEFDASPSTAPDGRSLTYEWDFDNDGSVEATGKQVSHTYTSFAEHRPTLTVKDNDGFTQSVTKRVRLDTLNMSVSASNTGVNAETKVSVDTSLDSAITEYRVDWGPESKAYNSEPLTYTYTSKGEYDIIVDIDINGKSYKGTNVEKSITIEDSPNFELNGVPSEANVRDMLSFSMDNLSSVSNPRFKWDFGDGTTTTGRTVDHSFSSLGSYTVTATVTGDSGITREKAQTVQVSELSAAFSVSDITPKTGQQIEFNASKSENAVNNVTYSWDLGDEKKTGKVVKKTYTTVGDVTVNLTVENSYGTVETAERTFTVTEPGTPSFTENFEDSGLEGWDTSSQFTRKTSPTFEGDGSGGIISGAYGDVATTQVYKDNGRPTSFTIYYYETTNSNSASILLKNSNGNTEAGFKTDNPQWKIYGDNGYSKVYGGDYTNWVKVEYKFNWGSNTFDYYIKDLATNHVETGTERLRHGVGIQNLSINNGFRDIHFWVDSISFESNPTAEIRTEEQVTTVQSGETLSLKGTITNGADSTYTWTFDDGTTRTGKNIDYEFTTVGEQKVELTVEDKFGHTVTDTKTFTVKDSATYLETFESDGLSSWNRKYASEVTFSPKYLYKTQNPPDVYNGDSAGYLSVGGEGGRIASDIVYPDGKTPTTFEYYYKETDGHNNAELKLLNSNNQVELGFKMNRPQVDLIDSNGLNRVYDGVSINRWMKIKVVIDWETNEFNYIIKDFEAGKTIEKTGRLRNGVDIHKIQLTDPNNEARVFFDDIRLDNSFDVSIKQPASSAVNVREGEATNLQATPDYGPAVTYTWDWGDGTEQTMSEMSASHTYTQPGTYTAKLTAKNGDGDISTDTQQITVIDSTGDYTQSFENQISPSIAQYTDIYHDSNRGYQSQGSIKIENNKQRKILADDVMYPDGKKVEAVSYSYRESEWNHGAGIRFVNSDGKYEVGFATDNPEWDISDADGTRQIYAGANYKEWIKVQLFFNWEDETYAYRIENMNTGTVKEGTGDLRHGKDIRKMNIENYNEGWFKSPSYSSAKIWIDEIRTGEETTDAYWTGNSNGNVGEQLTFDGTVSSASNSIESYQWDFGDGTIKTGQQVTHTYSSNRTYDVSLTITDSNGETDTWTQQVTVEQYYESFEDTPSMSWQIGNGVSFKQNINRRYAGDYGGTFDASSGSDMILGKQTAFTEGSQPDTFVFYYREENYESHGGGIRLQNTNGAYEVGFATDNPEWVISDANGFTSFSKTNNYNQWMKVRYDFEWKNNTFDYTITDLSDGTTVKETGELKHGKNIKNIVVSGFNADLYWTGQKQTKMTFDGIQFRKNN